MLHATWGWANKVHPSISQQHALGKMLTHKEWLSRKQINKHSILPFNFLAGFAKNVSGTGAIYD
jgi:hypothetical protein